MSSQLTNISYNKSFAPKTNIRVNDIYIDGQIIPPIESGPTGPTGPTGSGGTKKMFIPYTTLGTVSVNTYNNGNSSLYSIAANGGVASSSWSNAPGPQPYTEVTPSSYSTPYEVTLTDMVLCLLTPSTPFTVPVDETLTVYASIYTGVQPNTTSMVQIWNDVVQTWSSTTIAASTVINYNNTFVPGVINVTAGSKISLVFYATRTSVGGTTSTSQFSLRVTAGLGWEIV
ncbi:MAG TPA: hypothetical protein PKL04_06680 [Methanofastidiosum sp.]|nr:hypothetical protein [Methanofastidiosum sp.]